MGLADGAWPMVADDQRPSRALIDLDQLAANLSLLSAILQPGTRVMAVVKANAYGHGAPQVAAAALAAGAQSLAVATLDEARQLRAHGIPASILILSPVSPNEVPAALRLNIDLTVGSETLAAAVIASAQRTGEVARVHLKVDSGMHRGGCEPEAALTLAQQLSTSPGVTLAGLMTHFHSADEQDPASTQRQAERFTGIVAQLVRAGIDPGVVHAANSAAAIQYAGFHFDQVRFGIALYGLAPSPVVALTGGVRPVLTLESRLQRTETLRRGESVGYGGTYVATGGERTGLVPIGYADGYRRGLSHHGWMAAGGQRLPVLGRVSMDQTTILLPPAAGMLDVGDPVSVLGGDPAAPTADDLARLTGTINYEIMTGLAARLPRLYLRRGEVVEITTHTT